MSARLRRRYRTPPWFAFTEGAWLVSIDLGKRKVGVAVFDPEGTLKHVKTVYSQKKTPGRWSALTTAEDVYAWVERVIRGKPRDYVCEMPHLRGNERNGEVENLIAVGHRFPQVSGQPWSEKYRPSEWKSSVKKDLHHRRLLTALSVKEFDKVDGRGHDARDAVGIGLFALGRIDRIGRPT